jgi:hypothetical protein
MSYRDSLLNQSFTRRKFTALTAATLGSSAFLRATQPTAAQSMDPFTFIRTMPETETLGQLAGQSADEVGPIEADGAVWDALIQVPVKRGQWMQYTCEFDAAWSIMKAYGIEASLDDQVDAVGIDNRVVPYWDESSEEVIIYGGDIGQHFSGYLDSNLMSKSTSNAMRKAFEAFALVATPAQDRATIETAILAGHPVFLKATVDFLPWRQARWISPEGYEYPVVFSNDHALTVIGFNQDDVVIRDPLGPSTTNEIRPYQYRVTWDRFIEVLGAQDDDGLAVSSPHETASAIASILSDGTGGANTFGDEG